MFSFLLDRRSLCCRVSAAVFGMALLAAGGSAAQAQAPPAVEPVTPVPRIIVHGTASQFDLAEQGPLFSESWISTAIPALAALHEIPALLQRVTTNTNADASGLQTRTTYDRTTAGRPLERRVERRRGALWMPVRRTHYTYQDGLLIAQRTEVWLDGAWRPDQQITLVRKANEQVREVVQRVWRNEQWTNDARFTLSPADTGQVYRVVRATWREDTWKRSARITFTVAEEGRHITQQNETWTGTEWENSVRLIYMYDGAGYPIEKSLAVWTGQHWADGPLHLYDYDVRGQRVEQRTETWVGTRRVRVERAQLTYAAPVDTPLLGTASFD